MELAKEASDQLVREIHELLCGVNFEKKSHIVNIELELEPYDGDGIHDKEEYGFTPCFVLDADLFENTSESKKEVSEICWKAIYAYLNALRKQYGKTQFRITVTASAVDNSCETGASVGSNEILINV